MNGTGGKTVGALLGGALSTLVIWVVATGFGVVVPAEVAGALQVIATAVAVHFFPSGGGS